MPCYSNNSIRRNSWTGSLFSRHQQGALIDRLRQQDQGKAVARPSPASEAHRLGTTGMVRQGRALTLNSHYGFRTAEQA